VTVVEARRDLHELGGVEVEDALRLRVVAAARVVAGHREQVGEAERPGREHVRLKRQAVPVAARLLEDRLVSHLEDDPARGQAGQVE